MLLRLFPATSVVLGLLDERLMDETKKLSEYEADEARLENEVRSPKGLVMIGLEGDLVAARERLSKQRSIVQELQTKRILVQSSNQSSTQVEVEL